MKTMCGLLIVWLLGFVVAGCAAILGIEELDSSDSADAGLADARAIDAQIVFAVRGAASGILSPLSLRLEHTAGTELLSIIEDGPFEFVTELRAGDSYTVTLVGTPPCGLQDATGIVMAVDPMITLSCGLTGLVISSPSASSLSFDPRQTDYQLDVSLLQQHTTLTAMAGGADAIIMGAGEVLSDGLPSEPIPLALGDNLIEVAVTYPGASTRVYSVTVRRGASVAQYVYGKSSNVDAGDRFGISVAVSSDTLAVGAFLEDSGAVGSGGDQDSDEVANSGAVYVFRRSGSTWAQEAYLKASNTEAGDDFGRSVALSGDTLAVGAIGEDSAATGVGGDQDSNATPDSGAVYIFRRTGTTWTQEAYLKASNTEGADLFGDSVAVEDDTLVVSALFEGSGATGVDGDGTDNSAPFSGAVYVFRRVDSVWAQESYIKASNAQGSDLFGASVALSEDRIAIGAPEEASGTRGVDGEQADNSAPSSGAVYVFRRSGSTWVQEAYLKASNSDSDDRFGASVSLSGPLLAVGAPEEDSGTVGVNGDQDDDTASNSGAVYVFRRSDTTWTQEAYIKTSHPGTGDQAGVAVALSGDSMAVGVRKEDSAATGVNGDQGDGSAEKSGAVYVFQRAGAAWSEVAYCKASNTGIGDEFGGSVALSSDTLVVGAMFEASADSGIDADQADNSAGDSGAIYVFH